MVNIRKASLRLTASVRTPSSEVYGTPRGRSQLVGRIGSATAVTAVPTTATVQDISAPLTEQPISTSRSMVVLAFLALLLKTL